jgi:hypothetical protein
VIVVHGPGRRARTFVADLRFAVIALARKLAVIAYYRWRQALRGSPLPPKVEKVRECSWAGEWSEDRSSRSDWDTPGCVSTSWSS